MAVALVNAVAPQTHFSTSRHARLEATGPPDRHPLPQSVRTVQPPLQYPVRMYEEPPNVIVSNDIVAKLERARKSHDMAAFSNLLLDDAAFVNVAGMYARGREEIRTLHESAHAGIFRNRHNTNIVSPAG